MGIVVRTVTPPELPAWLDVLGTAFLSRNDTEAIAADVQTFWDLRRAWAAIDGSAVVGTTRSWATELTIPGNTQLPASAVAAVAVRATHRRQGILRQMMTAEHDAARERGEVMALLYSAEYPIYGRFGYGPGCQMAAWTIETRETQVRRQGSGSVEIVRPSPAVRDSMIAVHRAARLLQVGDIARRDDMWDRELGLRPTLWGDGWKGFVALHRDDAGTVDGFVRYHTESKWERMQPRGILTVDELCTLTDDGYDQLWAFLINTDMVGTIKAPERRVSERLPWLLTNARAASLTELADSMWVNLLDMPRALAARTYERAGNLVIETFENAGADRESRTRVALDVGPGGATCVLTKRSPDLTIHAGALGAAYLGGTSLIHASLAEGADEGREGALREADALFRTATPPWCSVFF
ncbi:MAG: GNAT family N-acetyltransferase [Chloroflexota bacterium]